MGDNLVMKSERNPSFDIVKFIVMIGVVAGHVGGYGVAMAGNQPHWITNVIIGVSMPVFFVISGYFAQSLFERGPLIQILKRTGLLLWPQLAVAGLFGLGMCCFYGLSAFRGAVRLIGGFWFLKNLAVIYCGSGLIYFFFKTNWTRWIGFLLFYLFFLGAPEYGLPSHYYWMTGYAAHMLPYFVFGLMVLRRHKQWIEPEHKNIVPILCGCVFAGVVFAEGDCFTNGMSFYGMKATFAAICKDGLTLGTFFGRTVVGITGSVALIWSVGVLVKALPRLSALAVYGTTTLGVYVIHEWLLVKLGEILAADPLPAWTCWPLSIAYFFFCHFIVMGIRSCTWIQILLKF